jgi:hypothetical protein
MNRDAYTQFASVQRRAASVGICMKPSRCIFFDSSVCSSSPTMCLAAKDLMMPQRFMRFMGHRYSGKPVLCFADVAYFEANLWLSPVHFCKLAVFRTATFISLEHAASTVWRIITIGYLCGLQTHQRRHRLTLYI